MWASMAIASRSRKRRDSRWLTTLRYHVARRRHGEADGGGEDRRAVAVEHAVGEQLQPQRQQGVGQHHQQRRRRATPAAAAARRGSRTGTCATAPGRRGGRSSGTSVERLMDDLLPVLVELDEARRLEVEHRAVAAAARHQLVVGAELDDRAVLEHADAVGVAHRREAVRDEDRRAARAWRRGCARRSPPRRARRAGPSARRAARRRRRRAPRTAPGPGRRAATARPTGRCRRGSPWRGSCRASARSPAPAACEGGDDVVVARRRRAPRCRAAAARSGRSPGTRRSRRRATRRGRAGAGRCRRPRRAPPVGS